MHDDKADDAMLDALAQTLSALYGFHLQFSPGARTGGEEQIAPKQAQPDILAALGYEKTWGFQ